MNCPQSVCSLLCAGLVISCGGSAKNPGTDADAADGSGTNSDAGLSSGDVLSLGRDVSHPADVPFDGIPAGDAAAACQWQSAVVYTLPHFRFLLTTPDGQSQSPPKGTNPTVDAGGWPIHDFEGKVTSRVGNQLGVDSCMQPGSCAASFYQFTLCDSSSGCRTIASPAPIEAAIPLGRRVRVVWHLDNDVPSFSPGLYFLAIYDAEAGASVGNLLFAGSGGRSDSKSGVSNPLQQLPFTVSTQALGCGRSQGGAGTMSDADDYAFIFAAKDGAAASLQLPAGQNGSLTVASPVGGTQRLQFHCLTAVQPNHTDDYWNWDFWASGVAASAAVDGGSGG
jgi:hypothetical protein